MHLYDGSLAAEAFLVAAEVVTRRAKLIEDDLKVSDGLSGHLGSGLHGVFLCVSVRIDSKTINQICQQRLKSTLT